MPSGRFYVLKHGLDVPLDGGVPIAPPGTATPTPPAPPTGGSGILIGATLAARPNGQTFAQAQSGSGPWTVSRSYNSGMLKATFAADAAADDVGKRASVFSFKPDLDQMASGALDAACLAWLRSIPDSHVVFVIPWHEIDVKIRKDTTGTYTSAKWRAAATRFFTLVRQVGKPHVYTTVCLSNWTFVDGGHAPLGPEFLLAPGLVDVLALDGYMESATVVKDGDYNWGAGREFADANGMGWAIAEAGMGGVATNFTLGATWMHTQADYAASNGAGPHASAAFLTWFDTDVGGVTPTPSGQPQLVTASTAIATEYLLPYTKFVL